MSKQAWNNYWASGLQSCFPKNSTADIQLQLVWRRAIQQLDLKTGAELLEIGCGNGFLTEIIIETLLAVDFKLNLIDYSKVQLGAVLAKSTKQINLIEEVCIEQMPFDNASIDIVLANFSFEYASTNEAVIQTCRVLKPGGRFLFNVHAKNSLVSRISGNVVAALAQLLASESLRTSIKQIISFKQTTEIVNNKPLILTLAKNVIDELKSIDVANDGGIGNSGVVDDILPLINTSNVAVSSEHFDSMWDNYRLYKERIEQQLAVGYNQSRIFELDALFIEHGVKIKVSPVYVENEIFSLMIEGCKTL